MKIIYFHQYFAVPTSHGGTRSYEMAKRLVAAGHQVCMVTTSAFLPPEWAPLDGWNQGEIDGIQVFALRQDYSNRTPFRGRILRFFQFALAAIRRGWALDGDLVFATSTPLTIAIPGVLVARRKRVPLVFEVRDLWPEVPIAVGILKGRLPTAAARALARWAYRHSRRVVVLSEGMAEGVRSAGFPAGRIALIPNSCDHALFGVPADRGSALRAELSWLGDRPLVLYPGTLGLINGVGYLVDVARRMMVVDPQIRFLVLGDGSEREQILSRARQAGVLDRNFFHLPPVPKYRLPDYFSAADLVLSLVIPVPILETNSANKFFDGLAAGRPVGVNHGGWQADLIEEHGLGVCLDPRDHDSAARCIATFLRDPARVSQARQAAGDLARGPFSRDKLAADLEAVLVAAAGDNGQGGGGTVLSNPQERIEG